MILFKPDPRLDFSGYEPYELSEIGPIAKRAERASNKLKTPDAKIRHLALAIEKISLIIDNSLLVNQRVEQEGEFYDPVDFWNQVDQAKSIRNRLGMQIKELELAKEESGNPEVPIEPAATIVNTPIPELKESDEVMDIEGIVKYLKSSKSTIYHMASEGEIPSIKIGGRRMFVKRQIDKWLEDMLKKQNSMGLHLE
jgi:excisionase family DNA binding protein